MADRQTLHNEIKIRKENIPENLLIIVVLVFSFIYFLFQLYLWFSSPRMGTIALVSDGGRAHFIT